MSGINCFLRYCNATVGDCNKNSRCKCLSCMGMNQDTCNLLKKEHDFNMDIQKMICSRCKKYNGK